MHFDYRIRPVGGEFTTAGERGRHTDRTSYGFIARTGTVIGGKRSVSPCPLPPLRGGDCSRAFEAGEAVQVPVVESELHSFIQEGGVYGRGRPSPFSSSQPTKS